MPAETMQDRYAPTAWGEGSTSEQTLPSGQLVLLRKVDPTDLFAEGLLDGLDSLTGIVDQQVTKASSRRPAKGRQKPTTQESALAAIRQDPDLLRRTLLVADQLMVRCVIAPKVALGWDKVGEEAPAAKGKLPMPKTEPVPEDKRAKDWVYTDTIAMGDKLYVFMWALGAVRQLESFRQQFSQSMAGLDAQQDVSSSA